MHSVQLCQPQTTSMPPRFLSTPVQGHYRWQAPCPAAHVLCHFQRIIWVFVWSSCSFHVGRCLLSVTATCFTTVRRWPMMYCAAGLASGLRALCRLRPVSFYCWCTPLLQAATSAALRPRCLAPSHLQTDIMPDNVTCCPIGSRLPDVTCAVHLTAPADSTIQASAPHYMLCCSRLPAFTHSPPTHCGTSPSATRPQRPSRTRL